MHSSPTRFGSVAIALLSLVSLACAQDIVWSGKNTDHVSTALSYTNTQQLGDYDGDGGVDDSRRYGSSGPGLASPSPLVTQVTGVSHILAASVFNIGGLSASAGSGSASWRNNATHDAIGTSNDDVIRFANTSSIASTQFDIIQGMALFAKSTPGGSALTAYSSFTAEVKNNFAYVTTNEIRWVVYDATLGNYYVSNTVYNLGADTAITTITKNSGFATETWALLPANTFLGSLTNLFDANTANFGAVALTDITYAGIFVNSRYDYGTSAGGASIDFAEFSADIAAIPEPSTYAMFAGGFAALSLMIFRRRRISQP